MEANVLISFVVCILIIGIFGRVFFIPLKKILKLIANSILGGILIYIINLVGSFFNFYIGINIITSIFVRYIRNSRGNIAGDI